MSGGVGLRLGQGVTLDKPVHLIHLDGSGEPASVVTRNVVLVEEGASLDLLESYASLGGRELQRNAVTEVEVGDKASSITSSSSARRRQPSTSSPGW